VDAERWRRVRELLDRALDLDRAARAGFVDAIEDENLRADVRRLLARNEQTTPLDEPAAAMAVAALAGGAAPRDWDREQIGRRIGAFQLDALLGAGGMGTVYRAHRADGRFEQTVAIKLVLSAHPGLRERFRKEQEILAGLRHPHIAQLIDGGETDDGVPYLAMEYVAGVPITDHCRERLPDVASRLRLVLRVAGALAHAHRNLVVHRDIKPSNILVSEEGHPMLLDFGIAKLVGEDRFRPATLQRIGPMTPAYAAPEQFRGGTIGVATDVYQLGVLMFRLIAGRLPYDEDPDDPIAWGRMVLEEEPITLGRALAAARRGEGPVRDAVRTVGREVDRDLDAIVRTAMAKNPARRYGSMDALVADIEAFLDGRPVQARRGGSLYAASRFVRRHALSVGFGVLSAIGLVALTVVALVQAGTAREEAARARVAVDYINAVFRAADPSIGRGGTRSAEDLLDLAAAEIRPKLEQHPDLRGHLLALIGTAYYNLNAINRSFEAFRTAIDDLRANGGPPMELAAALQRGSWVAARSGERALAARWADEAARLATGGDLESIRIRDGVAETRWLLARDVADTAQALRWAGSAIDDVGAAPQPDRDALRARALQRHGTSLTDARRFDEAEPVLREAIELAVRALGNDDYRTLRMRQTLGWHYTSRGEPARGLAELEPLGVRLRELFGDRSLDYAGNLYNRANAHAALGELPRALALYRESAATAIQSTAAGSSQVGWTLLNVASVLDRMGQHEEARGVYAEVEQRWAESMPEAAPVRVGLYADIARNRLALHDLDAADAYVDRAAGLADALAAAPTRAAMRALGAQVAEARGDLARAIRGYEAAAALLDGEADATDRDAWRAHAAALGERQRAR
jgi:serine/threonine-protein kinase